MTTTGQTPPRASHRTAIRPRSASRHSSNRRQLHRQRRGYGSRWTVVFDAENILAPLRHCPEALRVAFAQILELTGTPNDLRQGALVADRGIVHAVTSEIPDWLRPQITPDRAPNSADKELLRWLQNDAAPLGYDHLVLISGDGDFAGAVRNAKAAGRDITVIARRGSVHNELTVLADHLILIEYSAQEAITTC